MSDAQTLQLQESAHAGWRKCQFRAMHQCGGGNHMLSLLFAGSWDMRSRCCPKDHLERPGNVYGTPQQARNCWRKWDLQG